MHPIAGRDNKSLMDWTRSVFREDPIKLPAAALHRRPYRSSQPFALRHPSHCSPILSLELCSDVCTKYQEAAKIVNLALQGLVQQCVPGAKVIDLCEFGHSILNASAAKLYTKKSNGAVMDRGVAFPVCISVNDVVCNDSPLLSEERVRHHKGRRAVRRCGGVRTASVPMERKPV
jgi:hypothetical protein